jgi:hypothetical protein
MDIYTALTTLEDAVRLCITENVATEEVLAALDFLGAKAAVKWPFEQFREAITPQEGELNVNREGRRQLLDASLNGIKRAVLPKIGTRH